MEAEIKALLQELERKHDVEILYACETGSRAWGFPSPDSDYDVRIIYRHAPDWYLSLKERKDTIEFMSADGEMDVTGWDIKKALQLMWRSNGALLERVQSPIVYKAKDAEIAPLLRAHAFSCYSPIATMHHYLGMCKNSFADLEGQGEIKLKTLFYALRAALACRWIRLRDTPPPILFDTMVSELPLDAALKELIAALVTLKAGKPESYRHPAQPGLNALIAEEITEAAAVAEKLPGRQARDIDLDVLFRQVIKAQ